MNRQENDPGAGSQGQVARAAIGILLPVARITRPHGIRGALRLLPYSGDPATLEKYEEFFVQMDEGGVQPFCSLGCRSHGRFAVLFVKGIESRDRAESLTGKELYIDKVKMPSPGQDEFYWYDLVGRDVETEDGLFLGVVRGLMAVGVGPDLLQVINGEREILIPAVSAFRLDERGGRIVVALPPGFLEMNE